VYATAFSSFKEVLFLDADNTALIDPETLFDCEPYREAGAIFWPDFDVWEMEEGVWKVFGVPYHKERAFESGQYLIHKERCWNALMMAWYYADHSDFYFRHVYGDKECFHFGWRAIGQDFAMPVRGPSWEYSCCIVQHHPEPARRDEPIFLHRCGDKWNLGGNKFCEKLPDEGLHHQFARGLARIWTGRAWSNPTPNAREKVAITRLQFTTFLYTRVAQAGFAGDERLIEFLPGGRIGQGAAECETRWEVNELTDRESGKRVIVLSLCRGDRPTAHLEQVAVGVWKGRWLEHEKCLVRLTDQSLVSGPEMDPSSEGPKHREKSLKSDRTRALQAVLATLNSFGRTGNAEDVHRLLESSPVDFISTEQLQRSEPMAQQPAVSGERETTDAV
jgi:Mannosyltransferase putative